MTDFYLGMDLDKDKDKDKESRWTRIIALEGRLTLWLGYRNIFSLLAKVPNRPDAYSSIADLDAYLLRLMKKHNQVWLHRGKYGRSFTPKKARSKIQSVR